MSDRYANSRRLFERAQRSIAAGVNSGIRKMEQPVPLYFQHDEGARVWDADGNEYLDFQIGQGALHYGHAPAGMAAASWSASRRRRTNGATMEIPRRRTRARG